MKQCATFVLQVVAILAFTGAVIGNDEGEVVSNRICPLTLDKGEQMHGKISAMRRNCLDPTGLDIMVLEYAISFKDHKDFFKIFCGHQTRIRECLADVSVTSQLCQNEAQHQNFLVFRDMMETTLESGCAHDGEVLANIVTLYKHNSTVTQHLNPYTNCLITLTERFQLTVRQDISDLARNYIVYKDILQAKGCFSYITDGEDDLKNGIVTFLSEFLEKMKCFHPQDDSVLLCKNLDPKLDGSPRICPIKYVEGQTKLLYGVIRDRLSFCFVLTDANENISMLDIKSLDDSLKYYKNQCKKKPIVLDCLEDVVALSKACLNETRHLIMDTVEDLLKTAIEQVCLEDGRHFANIVSRDFTNTTEDSVIRTCISGVNLLGAAYDQNISSEKTLELYHNLKVFKGCLLDKLKGDDVAIASAELIMNGVINNTKCLNAETTALVLCESIANSD